MFIVILEQNIGFYFLVKTYNCARQEGHVTFGMGQVTFIRFRSLNPRTSGWTFFGEPWLRFHKQTKVLINVYAYIHGHLVVNKKIKQSLHVTIFRHGETLNYESMYLQMKTIRVITHKKQQDKSVILS